MPVRRRPWQDRWDRVRRNIIARTFLSLQQQQEKYLPMHNYLSLSLSSPLTPFFCSSLSLFNSLPLFHSFCLSLSLSLTPSLSSTRSVYLYLSLHRDTQSHFFICSKPIFRSHSSAPLLSPIQSHQHSPSEKHIILPSFSLSLSLTHTHTHTHTHTYTLSCSLGTFERADKFPCSVKHTIPSSTLKTHTTS